jgi:NAD(P)-dependent dehydrogenase (short-subunit alcohol dehydrogenase family)
MPLTPDRVLLTDKVAVVTGAAVGIGAAIATAFAAFGAHLAMCDRDTDNLERVAAEARDQGRTVVTGALDVRDTEQVEQFVDSSAARLGRIDVLVNNAGGGFQANYLDVNAKGQDALVRENFTSVTNFVRAAVPHMPADTGGSIINLTSIEAHRAAPGFAIYAAMKTAVMSLTRSLALELGPRLVRVNCIAPDVIPTPGIGDDFGVRTPLPVKGHVDDCAGAAIYLASDLSRFVTGATIHVDGGNLASSGWVRHADGSYGTGA